MGNITGNVFTKEERNLKSFYRDVIKDAGLPSLKNYPSHWDWITSTIVMDLMVEYSNGGIPGLEAYMAKLCEREDPRFSRLGKFLLNDFLGAEGSAGTLLSDVEPQKTPWLWYPRLALGKITTFDGDPGLGKSLIGADIGARITRGEKMPDGAP